MDSEPMRGKARGLKRLLGLALVSLLIIPSVLVLQPFLGGEERTAAAESVPSTVTGELIYKDTTIEQSSDITIESGGKLILINSVLTMMCDASHTYKITVNSGGLLKVVEGSTIQANNDNYGYSLKVNRGGPFIAEESTIEDLTSCGTDCNRHAIGGES